MIRHRNARTGTMLLTFVVLGNCHAIAQSQARDPISVSDSGILRWLPHTKEQMLNLVFGPQEFPGFELVPNRYNGFHTNVILNVGGNRREGAMFSKVIRCWNTTDGSKGLIDLTCTIHESSKQAIEALEAARKRSNTPWRTGASLGTNLGDKCYSSGSPYGASTKFAIGKAVVRIFVRAATVPDGASYKLRDAPADFLAEAISHAMEYRLRQNPVIAGLPTASYRIVTSQTVKKPTLPVFDIGGEFYGPLSVLEQAGAKVTWESSKFRATVSFGDRKVNVQPLSKPANSTTARPVFLSGKEVIVPLRSVATELGMTLQSLGRDRIEITRKKT